MTPTLAARAAELRAEAGLPALPAATPDEVVAATLEELAGRLRTVQADTKALMEQRFADVAHDLKGPLTSLLLTLEAGGTTPDEGGVRKLLLDALRDTVRLDALLDNLRVEAWLQRGVDAREPLRPLDLTAVVRRVVQRIESAGNAAGIVVAGAWPDEPTWVAGRAAYAEQAVLNLALHALERADRHVSVSLVGDAEGFVLRAMDDGPAAPAADLERCRDPLPVDIRGADRRARRGLAILATVCDRHGWTLRFTVPEGMGLDAMITGPVCAAPPRSDSGSRVG